MGRRYFFILFFSTLSAGAFAQTLLGRKISLQSERQPLASVLRQIELQGGFRFSYNSSILPADSLVNLHARQITVEEALDRLLDNRYEYRTAHEFVVIRYAPLRLSLNVRESSGNAESYLVIGQVVDKVSGKPLLNASVYEKTLLQSTLTDANGFFSLRLKNNPGSIELTISKENYRDLSTHFLSEVTVNGSNPNRSADLAFAYRQGDEQNGIENTIIGRWFITSRQRIQGINIGSIIARAPFQASLSPGLSSHGALSGQVVNKFSINATGGYTAGVDGLEVGLGFNISKGNVRWLQVAGGFNIVGGQVQGMQVGGFYNQVRGDVSGVQIALGANRVRGAVQGFQLGGLYSQAGNGLKGMQVGIGYNTAPEVKGIQIGLANHVSEHVNGMQIGVAGNLAYDAEGAQLAGIANLSRNFKGTRFALLANLSTHTGRGLQVAGLLNYARHLRGFQLALINVADTSSGYSFGLLNVVPKGVHQLELSSNESIAFNAALKTGNQKFYTILAAGRQAAGQPTLAALGFGFGKAAGLGRRLALHPELTSRYLYQGEWQYTNLLNRFDLKLHFKPASWLAVSAGPAFNAYYSNQRSQLPGYAYVQERGRAITLGLKDTKAWIGWSAGISIF
ncbi:hypothetical protein C7T94_07635 [Pedobacter yulinensis]|uniref:Secretin/TonB short N-terminal domain-containing protein n=1 Tax=Pedobacter yulinensis TaxID=2126353 RepID=A0A2T3HJA5_9SPHI|nr:carboxypeptidase-like regulatory domain-containing protein [Pedobacter yulinensis]PST82535.1 hypothetical protein C7T94_07635 [Pedobacter yulinensis]